MIDIAQDLQKIIQEKHCSPLLALIVIKDGICIQESESDEEFSRRLCDQRDINSDKQALGIHLHGDCDSRI